MPVIFATIDSGIVHFFASCFLQKGQVVRTSHGTDGIVEVDRVLPPGRQYFFFMSKYADSGVFRYMVADNYPTETIQALLPPEKASRLGGMVCSFLWFALQRDPEPKRLCLPASCFPA